LTDDAERDAELGPRDDLDEFGRAFAEHEGDVVRVCRRLLGAAEDARDAPQEVFLRASRSLHTYDRDRPLRPWLLAIAGNYCIDRLRQQATEQRVFADLDPEDAPVDPAAERHAPSPLGRLIALEEREAIGRAVAALPLKYRLPLALRYFNDLDYDAIAEALGVSRGQVGTLLFRAKQRLREGLGGGPRDTRRKR
jgi:RNA polymerase sigma-70 factor (ECF subfamily)